MSVYAISDLHLSLSADKSMEIFRGWENYVEKIEKNWRAIIKPTDTVVIPGDISWAMKLADTYKDFEFIHNLPGKKIIGKGNHDLWWETLTKMNNYLDENGFDTISFLFNNAFTIDGIAIAGSRGWFFDDENSDKKVINREASRIDTSIKFAQKAGLETVVFLHYPPATKDAVCDEIMEVLVRSGIKTCYYGHIHGASRFSCIAGNLNGINFSPISADILKFVPKLVY